MASARKAAPQFPGAEGFLPARLTLSTMRASVATCEGCSLYKDATQPVFGEGKAHARVMLIGEQPGDSEDLAGRPFVGPAGKLLDEALEAAGIPRDEAYVTNAVKHFKFTRRGKRRIHDKPTRYEVTACKPWLSGELQVLAPEIVVLLGATAAQALLGSSFRVTQQRGVELATPFAPHTFATVHPASVLRAPDDEMRAKARAEFIADLTRVGACFQQLAARRSRDDAA